MNMNNKPFIHLFMTPLGFYVYDVNTAQILKVSQEVYRYLEDPNENIDTCKLHEISTLIEDGFLKTNRVTVTEHPFTELLPFALQTHINNMILQVTQNCNLRCEYCIYSGNYNTRGHSNKRMTFETAKKAIDFLIKHASGKNDLFVGFYGGEPLLEFELIKKCVDYIEKEAAGKNIGYIMTTNGTLLNENVIDYLVKHKFKITISVDGPKDIHNRSRIFANQNKGSYDVMIANIKKMKEKAPQYYQECVRFNTVMLTDDGFSCLENYFQGDELFADSYFSASTVSTSYSKKDIKTSEIFIQEQQYELFKFFLGKLGRLSSKHASVLLKRYFDYLYRLETIRKQLGRQILPNKWHRSGPCIPGVSRIFVTVDGDLLPCERVCEIAEISKLGTIDEGIDIGKAEKIMNLEKYTESVCHNCWAYSECTTCMQCCDGEEESIRENILNRCNYTKNTIEDAMKDCTVLKELGYDFESDSVIENTKDNLMRSICNE